jgi:excisionase family DNA binding protein
METLLLRAIEVQIALGLCRSKVYEMMSNGELPVVRIGRSVRVPADGLREWVESHRASTEDNSHD